MSRRGDVWKRFLEIPVGGTRLVILAFASSNGEARSRVAASCGIVDIFEH